MPRQPKRYPPEFRRQLIELVRAGRSPESLSKESEPSSQTFGPESNRLLGTPASTLMA